MPFDSLRYAEGLADDRQQCCAFGVAVSASDALASSSWVVVYVLLLHGVFLRGCCVVGVFHSSRVSILFDVFLGLTT